MMMTKKQKEMEKLEDENEVQNINNWNSFSIT